jgi:hypothetical protein
MLARHVGRGTGATHQPLYRRRVDDGSAALLKHPRDLVPHAQPHTLEINADDAVPTLLRVFVRGSPNGASDARVVEGAVETAIGRDGMVDQRLDLGCHQHIGFDKDRLGARLPDDAYGFFTPVNVHIRDDDRGSFSGKGE